MIKFKELPAEEFCGSVRDGTHDSPKSVPFGKKLITTKHMRSGRLDFDSAYCISEEDFRAINARSKVDRWDVLISMIGTVGEVCLVKDNPDYAIKNVGLFKSKSELLGKFTYYYFLNPATHRELISRCRGTTQLYISLGELRKFPIRFPESISEMEKIVSILTSLDNKIELNRKTNETLEAMAQAIFKDWFVDFGPVRRKIAGASEPSTILGGLLPPDASNVAEIANLFPDRLADNGLPEGWDRTTVKSIAKNVSNGGTPKRSMPCYWNNGNVPWLTSGEVRQRFVLATENFISTEGLRNSSAKMLPAGCILVALYGATAGQISFNIEPLSTNQAVCAVEPEQNSQFFLLLSLRRMVQKLSESAVGSAQQNISKKIVEEIEVDLPSGRVLDAFQTFTSPVFAKVFASHRENQALAETRDYLLPRLMNGSISISEEKTDG